jgi:hypothetical protein
MRAIIFFIFYSSGIFSIVLCQRPDIDLNKLLKSLNIDSLPSILYWQSLQNSEVLTELDYLNWNITPKLIQKYDAGLSYGISGSLNYDLRAPDRVIRKNKEIFTNNLLAQLTLHDVQFDVEISVITSYCSIGYYNKLEEAFFE